MNPAWIALILGIVQTIAVVLLAGDRWVHRVTGREPIESQVQRLTRIVGVMTRSRSEDRREMEKIKLDIRELKTRLEERDR